MEICPKNEPIISNEPYLIETPDKSDVPTAHLPAITVIYIPLWDMIP